jgi:hypothetical protein
MVSRKIGIFLTGLIFLAGAAVLTPSLCGAGMHELSNGDMAAVYAQGFSSFTLSTDANGYDLVKLNFSGVTLSTWTQMDEMSMGLYLKAGTTAWDNNWTNVSLGSAKTDLVAVGLYIDAGFSGGIGNTGTRQLEYVNIGTTSLTGTVTADFNSLSGTVGGATYNRSNLGVQTITSTGGGFYLSLQRSGSQMGYTFNFGAGSHL